MRLLLLNPNTSIHITERLAASARTELQPQDELHTRTAQVGPRAVRSEAQALEAARRIVAMAQAYGPGHDAVLIGISLDCGLAAAQALLAPQPVIGMTQAACQMTAAHGPKFGLLTLGAAMAPLYRAHVQALGLESSLAGIFAPDLPQAFEPGEPVMAEVVNALCTGAEALMAQGAQSLVLAGAVLCGYAEVLQARLGCPVLDGMRCAVLQARARLAMADRTASGDLILKK